MKLTMNMKQTQHIEKHNEG